MCQPPPSAGLTLLQDLLTVPEAPCEADEAIACVSDSLMHFTEQKHQQTGVWDSVCSHSHRDSSNSLPRFLLISQQKLMCVDVLRAHPSFREDSG